MPVIKYRKKNIGRGRLELIAQANAILVEFEKMGYDLTLRGLYYRMVARGFIPNTLKSYKRFGDLIDDGRMCGMIDWLRIEDRTRNMQRLSRWSSAEDMLATAAGGFHMDRWATQDTRVEVWVEKEGLVGIFSEICDRFDVPYFACKGYTSQSEMWRAACRIKDYSRDGKRAVILHFGDHDPSGIDMTRDIGKRLETFGAVVEMRRLALNMDQIEEHNPPPNPAKMTDSRFKGYAAKFGDESWEIEALPPNTVNALVKDHVDELRDMKKWRMVIKHEKHIRARLMTVRTEWNDVVDFINEEHDDTLAGHARELDREFGYKAELAH